MGDTSMAYFEKDVKESIARWEERAKLCLGVFRESSRRVLSEIVNLWVNGEEATIYRLESRELKEMCKASIENAVKVLNRCGFITAESRRPKTNSPKGKKLLYPTPLGVVASIILTLLHPEELGISGFHHLGEEVSVNRVKIARNLACHWIRYYLIPILNIAYEKTSCQILKDEDKIKETFFPEIGYASLLHITNVLCAEKLSWLDCAFSKELEKSATSSEEKVKQMLSDALSELERLRANMKEYIFRAVLGDTPLKIADYLEKAYKELLSKTFGVHEEHEKPSRVTT
jgi:hypothetical protein